MVRRKALIGRERQRKLLQQAGLATAQHGRHFGGRGLAAEDLRLAASCLGRLLGRIDVEDILDVVFRDFCIGK